ncbi:hypothetical protein [Nocardia salmonicida]|uniref:hypothetical protein n=1 Tax=Nocardia salmonicida TaxID=53431 RepID=UPI0007A5568A|nr:hypothetical protein [Nocardia salmonicida]
MDNSRAKLVGPAVAVGAVSLGLIIIGACGVGQQDVYVPAPPLSADLAAAPARVADEPTSTTVHISIPPSPSWRIAPYMSPRKPFSLSSTETSPSETPTEGGPAPEPRPGEATTESRPAEASTRPPETTEDEPTTTRPQIPTRPNPTRTVTPPRVGDDEAAEDYPPTHAFDHATPTPVVPADTGATPTPATTTEASTTTDTPAPTTAES